MARPARTSFIERVLPCGRQGKNSGKRDGVGHRTPGKYQIPGVAVIQQSGGNQLGAINDRSSSYCKQIVHLFLLSESDGLTQGLDGRVGFNSPKLYSEMILQCFFHLVIYTILFVFWKEAIIFVSD